MSVRVITQSAWKCISQSLFAENGNNHFGSLIIVYRFERVENVKTEISRNQLDDCSVFVSDERPFIIRMLWTRMRMWTEINAEHEFIFHEFSLNSTITSKNFYMRVAVVQYKVQNERWNAIFLRLICGAPGHTQTEWWAMTIWILKLYSHSFSIKSLGKNRKKKLGKSMEIES